MKMFAVSTLFLVVFLLALLSGRYPLEMQHIYELVFSGRGSAETERVFSILYHIRFPRVMTAMIIGGSLSVAGVVYQGIFRNPMVSPAILGASSGAAFGASLGILLGFSIHGIELVAFLSGLLAVGITCLLAAFLSGRNRSILILILAGMLVSTLFSSLISLIKYVADPYSKLPDITFWLLGSLSSVTVHDTLIISTCSLAGFVPLFLVRWKINVLSLDEEEARSLGVNIRLYQVVIIAAATLMTSVAVSVCGLIGWVGLVVPHMVRMIFGPDYKILLPATIVIGSIYLLLIDTIARSVSSLEIPLGILTSLIGAPFFVFLMSRVKRGWV
jgi:iron complex transport system permease protein